MIVTLTSGAAGISDDDRRSPVPTLKAVRVHCTCLGYRYCCSQRCMCLRSRLLASRSVPTVVGRTS